MAARAVVRRDRDGGVGGGHGAPCVGRHERLVAEADDDGAGPELAGRLDAAPQRRDLAVGPVVVDDVDDARVDVARQLTSGDDDHRADTGAECGADRAIDEGLTADRRVELVAGSAETGPTPGRQDDGDDGRSREAGGHGAESRRDRRGPCTASIG